MLSVSTSGVLGHELSKASLSLDVESPVSQGINFLAQVAKTEIEDVSKLDFKLQTHSEAEYWEAFSAELNGKWDGSQIDGVTKMDWGDVAVHLNVSGLYETVGNEHQVAASAELKVPSLNAWSQLKTSLEGKLFMKQNPSTVKITQVSVVEKDYEEVFSSRGAATISLPEVKGDLSVFHSGNLASRQSYSLQGNVSGQEVEILVSGTVDGEPVKAVIHFVHSKQLRIQASYRSEDYLSLSLLTELQDFLTGTIEEVGPAYSLSTEGQLVVMGQHTKMSHHLSISPSLASSSFKLVPIGGKVLMLKTTRTKLGLNHWRTDISLTWGQRVFTYSDEVSIPSLTELSLRIEVDAPALLFSSVLVMVEAAKEAQGGQTVKLLLQERNSTIHSARVVFYKYDTDGESVWQAGATEVVINSQTYQDVMFHHAVIPLTAGLEVKSNMTVGHTPLVMVGVRATPSIRALGLALCTTDEECVRVQTQAVTQNTPSTRTLSISAHALNSLFWKDPHEPLIQNSATFLAEETPDRTLVSGGVNRLECEEISCITATSKSVLHASLLFTHNTLDMMINTTHRTIALASVLKEGHAGEMLKTSLPGGILNYSAILENQLWFDREQDPQGAIKWTTSLASFVSLRASEFAFLSSLHHPSFTKALDIEGSILLGTKSTISLSVILDIFSLREDALKVNIEVQQERGKYILHGILSVMSTAVPVANATAIVVPSPDSSKVSIVVVLPSSSLQLPATALPTKQFRLTCGLDTLEDHMALSCKLVTPSVYEKVSLGYQRWETKGCVGGTSSLALLNHAHEFQHTSCHDPANLQMTLSHSAEGHMKEKLSLKLGMVDVHRAEVDLLGAAGLSVQLHPPFLLHVSAHHSQSLHNYRQHIMARAREEVGNMTFIAKNVVQDLMEDLRSTESLSLLSGSISAPTLTHHLYNQGMQILQEMQHDQLVLDIMQSIQASIDVTSIIVEAGFAYISHNYGETFYEVMTGTRMWLEDVTTNTGALCAQLMEDIRENIINIIIIINNIPHLLLEQVKLVPLLNEAVEWVFAQIHLIQQSTVYGVTRDSVSFIMKIVNKAFSFIYSEEETLSNKKYSDVWNIWVPLGECSHSLPEVWQHLSGTSRWVPHRESLGTTLLDWWHLLRHPLQLLNYLFPPYPGEGAIIGDNNFITIDGRTFSLTPSCKHILLTDAKQELFTLVSQQQGTASGTNYTLLLGNTTVDILSDLQVTINSASVSLPHISKTLSLVRRLHELEVTAKDAAGHELVSLTCWLDQRACVVGVSGWLHADTRGLLGNFNLNPADDFMRPSGKVALTRDIFSESWQLGSDCVPERDAPVPTIHPHAQLLCHKFLLHYTAPVFACHEAVNIMPFYNTCLRYLNALQGDIDKLQAMESEESSAQQDSEDGGTGQDVPSVLELSSDNTSQNNMEAGRTNQSNNTIYEINIKDVLFQLTDEQNVFTGASLREISALCDVAAAYASSCSRHKVDLNLPVLCGRGKQLTYDEPLSREPQLDLVMLINEEACDSFIYQNLVRPLPQVITRVGQGRNISNIQIGVLGYGSDNGEVVYRTKGTALLTPASELRVNQPPEGQRSQASLLNGMRAISKFPFRAGSVRIALTLRCDDHDIPKFTETLPKEMQRRRLALFTLTPDVLMFNPRRPKAVRNTIGMDRWRVYNLRLDRQHSSDSWGIRAPSSNIAQLAMKSGGGVFSLAALRNDERARYHMKLFRRVLSKAIIKVVVNAHRQGP